jgi:uncharacterized membrane protein YfcA
MDEITLTGMLALGLAALLTGMAKAGIPGLAFMAVPLFAMAVPPKASTGLLLPLLIVGDIFAVSWHHRSADWHLLRRLLPCAVGGIVLGALLLGQVDDRALRLIMGSLVMVMLLLHEWRKRRAGTPPAWLDSPRLGHAVGAVGGVTTMMANAAGPVMSLYFLAMRLPKREFIGTVAWFFLMVNLIKVPFSAGLGLITGPSLRLNLELAPLVLVGAALGIWLAGRLDQARFERIVEILTAIAAIRLLIG